MFLDSTLRTKLFLAGNIMFRLIYILLRLLAVLFGDFF